MQSTWWTKCSQIMLPTTSSSRCALRVFLMRTGSVHQVIAGQATWCLLTCACRRLVAGSLSNSKTCSEAFSSAAVPIVMVGQCGTATGTHSWLARFKIKQGKMRSWQTCRRVWVSSRTRTTTITASSARALSTRVCFPDLSMVTIMNQTLPATTLDSEFF